ncbi:ABC transporter ATP-binding protein [Antrihabitans sp. YC3-6]|uniref:ABC transporter ATP-binding protein n=1 Tax=Antrihabitans stalagmiti TaxID=2799499 RepID=A0A934NWK6_9NOCA|nr:ABC transporter ATP-binding protein [Antrihabitans stalagmiti]MBJ8342726.1 ABC transporter ATP-binding protein [Antrihabitans stalagmiti]
MTEPVLSVEAISVSYGRIRAVENVTFAVPAGGLVTLVGANGAGKTSVLSGVSGLVKLRSGRVRFEGSDVTKWSAHKLVKAGLVGVPEGREILAAMTVHENLLLGGWHRRRSAATTIDEMYQRFPVLAQRRDLSAGSLSGGEQQMLAIARALVAKPTVLLMDEPSMGLAPLVVDEIFRVIAEIRSSGTTVVLVEQNARRALRVADYGYVMETGSITQEGPAADLIADQRIVSAYLGLD